MKILIGIVAVAIALLGLLVVALDSRESSDAGNSSASATSTVLGNGELGRYSLSEISSHKGAESCYAAIDGSVYDLTPWIEAHPGGAENILILCGRDGTKEFKEQHGESEAASSRLDSFKIGTLQ